MNLPQLINELIEKRDKIEQEGGDPKKIKVLITRFGGLADDCTIVHEIENVGDIYLAIDRKPELLEIQVSG